MAGRFLSLRLAVQNLGRRRVRSTLLALTVAVGGGAIFSALVLRQAIQESGLVGLSRMGADLMIVPRDATINLTPALLTTEPTPYTIPAAIYEAVRGLPQVEEVAPQRYFAVALGGQGHQHLELIAFDPQHDFTVMPWLHTKLERAFRRGDVIVGARREEAVGATIDLFGSSFTVYGKLALTGVGPFERCIFLDTNTATDVATAAERTVGRPLMNTDPRSFSALLVRLAPGSTAQQLRFATTDIPDIKLVAGSSLYASVRQGLSLLLWAVVGLTVLMLASTMLMVAALYSGLLAERRRELGLFLAIGLRPRQMLKVILTEAILTTGMGGISGVLLGVVGVSLLQRTLGYYFARMQMPFALPSLTWIVAAGVGSILLTCVVGVLGAFFPAWSVGHREPHELVRGEG
jgi:putative ABC transport system permease protein